MTASPRSRKRKPRDMQRREPRPVEGDSGCTATGNQPLGVWVIFASSWPTNRGMEGPVRSMSRIPTDFPRRESARASCSVTEDLPTPPLPDRTWILRVENE